jgi:hypothetical protein
MAITLEELNLEENVFYQDAVAKGLSQGFSQGLSQGLSQGARNTLLAVLRDQFGPLPLWATDQIDAADSEQLLDWTIRSRKARSLAALLKATKK